MHTDLILHYYLTRQKGNRSTANPSSKPAQHLRSMLRAHLMKGGEAATAACMWVLAIARGSTSQTQLQLLSEGVVDVLCDSVSRVLLVCFNECLLALVAWKTRRATQVPTGWLTQIILKTYSENLEHTCHNELHRRCICTMQGTEQEFEAVAPQVAVILELATHPAFPARALQGLPTLCRVAVEAAATNSMNTLAPVLAAIYKVCAEAGGRLVYPDVCSLTSSLLSLLPAPLEEDTAQALMPAPEVLRCMITAVACVMSTLVCIFASGPAWLRLHTTVLLQLQRGLKELPYEVLTVQYDILEALGQADGTLPAHLTSAVEALELQDSTVNLLSLSATLHKHLLKVHRDVVLRSTAASQFSRSQKEQAAAAVATTACYGTVESDDLSFIAAASGLLSCVIVPCMCHHLVVLQGVQAQSVKEQAGVVLL